MGGGGKGSSDQSGMYAAMASAQAAQQAYQLGSQQLDWTKQTWGQEWPYVQQAAQTQIQSQQQLADFSKQQEQFYANQYVPMQTAYNQMVANWASPEQIAQNAGQAMGNVNEAVNAQKQGAISQLEGYGVNPGATRFGSLFAGMGVQGGAASAGAGTQAIQNTKLQQLGMMAGAINTGQGQANQVASLAGVGTGAGSAASSGLTSALGTGASAMAAPTAWYNAGANNMNTYVNAVNGYNQTQLGYAQVGAQEFGSAMSGLGSAAGMGMYGMGHGWFGAKGGEVEKFQDGGAIAPRGAISRNPYSSSPQYNPPVGYFTGGDIGDVGHSPPISVPMARGGGIGVGQGIPPRGGTPGGFVSAAASPSAGQVQDDVDAKLTAGEFVAPLDVVKWKGQEFFYKLIDKSRTQEAMQKTRGDIGGEPSNAIPSPNPAFVSRPNVMPGTMPQGAMPARPAMV